jgi:hypothetical protein
MSASRISALSVRCCELIHGRSRVQGSWFGVSAGKHGDVAQLVEHLLCKQGVGGSSPLVSTKVAPAESVATGTSLATVGRGSVPRPAFRRPPESLFAIEALAWFEAGG